MRTLLPLLVATLVLTGLSAQSPLQSFQVELTGGLSSSKTDTNPDLEVTRLLLGGTYYLRPVELKDHPWNEAAFLERSMGAMAEVRYTDFEIASFDANGPLVGLGFAYADPETPFAGEVRVSFGTLDGDMGIDVDQTEFQGRGGYWLQPNAQVGVDLAYEEIDASGLLEIERTHVGGYGKIVYGLEEGRAINAEAHLGFASVDVGSSSDTNFEIGVAGDFYFTPRYSVGAMLDLSFGDAVSEEGTTFGVRGSAWVTPNTAVRVQYSMFSASDSAGADEDEFGLFVAVRL